MTDMMISFIDFFELQFPRCNIVVHELHDGDYICESSVFQIAH